MPVLASSSSLRSSSPTGSVASSSSSASSRRSTATATTLRPVAQCRQLWKQGLYEDAAAMAVSAFTGQLALTTGTLRKCSAALRVGRTESLLPSLVAEADASVERLSQMSVLCMHCRRGVSTINATNTSDSVAAKKALCGPLAALFNSTSSSRGGGPSGSSTEEDNDGPPSSSASVAAAELSLCLSEFSRQVMEELRAALSELPPKSGGVASQTKEDEEDDPSSQQLLGSMTARPAMLAFALCKITATAPGGGVRQQADAARAAKDDVIDVILSADVTHLSTVSHRERLTTDEARNILSCIIALGGGTQEELPRNSPSSSGSPHQRVVSQLRCPTCLCTGGGGSAGCSSGKCGGGSGSRQQRSVLLAVRQLLLDALSFYNDVVDANVLLLISGASHQQEDCCETRKSSSSRRQQKEELLAAATSAEVLRERLPLIRASLVPDGRSSPTCLAHLHQIYTKNSPTKKSPTKRKAGHNSPARQEEEAHVACAEDAVMAQCETKSTAILSRALAHLRRLESAQTSSSSSSSSSEAGAVVARTTFSSGRKAAAQNKTAASVSPNGSFSSSDADASVKRRLALLERVSGGAAADVVLPSSVGQPRSVKQGGETGGEVSDDSTTANSNAHQTTKLSLLDAMSSPAKLVAYIKQLLVAEAGSSRGGMSNGHVALAGLLAVLLLVALLWAWAKSRRGLAAVGGGASAGRRVMMGSSASVGGGRGVAGVEGAAGARVLSL